MTARNQLLQAPPYPVEQALTQLGENLRTARIRRNFTIGIYVALLWVFDLLPQLNDVANPAKDEQGLALAAPKEKTRARKSGELDSDF
jgi:hypothetical protein